MLRNYFKIASRNIWKNKLFSFINIISLAIGLSASFVIGLMVYYDFTFDKFHKDGDFIYRVTTDFNSPNGFSFSTSGVPVPLTTALKQEVTGVQKATAFFMAAQTKVTGNSSEKVFYNPEKVIYADKDFFSFLEYDWIAGNSASALKNPNELVLTEARAKKYFPNQNFNDIIGQTLTYDDSISTTVTGIVANFKDRTDFTFQEFISLETAKQSNMKDQIMDDNWNGANSGTQFFIKLNNKNNLASVQKQLGDLAKKNENEDAKKSNHHMAFYLQPLSDLHFNKDYGIFNFTEYVADKSVLTSLMFVALFLLTLGCINFINLNTAQASQRAKEIGVRKTLGSSRKQLVYQFLGETFLLTLSASILSLVFAALLIKVFADFLPEGIQFGLFADPVIIGFGMVLILIVTLLSGFYPALVLSSFKPISILKNSVFSMNNSTSLRKGLIVFQFVIAQVFIISTLMVTKQIHFLMTKDMGFKTDAIAYVRTPSENVSIEKRKLFVEKLKTIPQIENISLGGTPPASSGWNMAETYFMDGEKTIKTTLQLLFGDKNYRNLYDIKLLAGRDLRNDTVQEYIINDTYRKTLGFKTAQDAIGKNINRNIDQGSDTAPIVGVMQDFNQHSLQSNIEPMALIGDWHRSENSKFNTVHFLLNKANSSDWSKVIANVEDNWKSIYPGADFDLNFMDETIQEFYQKETSMTKLLNWATGLSVLIGCLGLLGLVIHTTERRVKEIGVRKILGASIIQLNILLCKDFLKLVIIAFVIAAPIAWYGLHNWLEDYAYKTSLSWWVFALSGFGILFLALGIMSLKTVSISKENPVKSLRTE